MYVDDHRAVGFILCADEDTDAPRDKADSEGAQNGGEEGRDAEARYEDRRQTEGDTVNDEVEQAEGQ